MTAKKIKGITPSVDSRIEHLERTIRGVIQWIIDEDNPIRGGVSEWLEQEVPELVEDELKKVHRIRKEN